MKKLSEIDNGEYVMYETYNGREEYVPKEDIYCFLKEEGDNIKAVYSTERKAVKINKYHLDDFLEMFENQVHEEWAEEMFKDIINTPEKVFKSKKFTGITLTDVLERITDFANQNNIEIIEIVIQSHFTPYVSASLLYREVIKMTYAEKIIELGKELGVDIEFITTKKPYCAIHIFAEGLMVKEKCLKAYFNISNSEFKCNDDCVKCWNDEYKNEKVLCLLDKEVVK